MGNDIVHGGQDDDEVRGGRGVHGGDKPGQWSAVLMASAAE